MVTLPSRVNVMEPWKPIKSSPLVWAALAGTAVLFWWTATVWANYKGNWTALYCTGAKLGVPAALAARENVYLFPKSYGFDGQYYHLLAHDPFLRTDFWKHIDAPRYRARRILVPLLAHALALGRSGAVDAAYLMVMLGAIIAGVYWLSRYAVLEGAGAAWGMGFLAIPGVLVSIDRLTVDGAFLALCAGFALSVRLGSKAGAYAAVLVACLTRETGLILVAALCGAALLHRRWRTALVFSTAALPALAWYAYLAKALPPSSSVILSTIPFHGLMHRIIFPPAYSFPHAWVVHALHYLALAGVALAVVLAVQAAAHSPKRENAIALLLFTALAAFLGPGDPWENSYSFARTLSPLLLLLALEPRSLFGWLRLAPIALSAPSILMYFTPQLLGITRRLAGL